MFSRIHVIDANLHRRWRVSHELNVLLLHPQIYEDLTEFLQLSPRDGLILASDDVGPTGQRVSEIINCPAVDLPIVGFAENPSTEQIVEAMLAGAAGYLRWPFQSGELATTLSRMLAEGEKLLRQRRRFSEARAKVSSLSRREGEVLQGIVDGLSTKKIAETLGISPRTVEIHRAHMMRKLEARSVAVAVKMGISAGLGSD